MLHLIWSKGNRTSEDGKELEGVRSRLLECYPNQQVNQTTESMVELALKICPLHHLTPLGRHMI